MVKLHVFVCNLFVTDKFRENYMYMMLFYTIKF